MVVPGKAVAETVELARQEGAPIRKKPEEIYDNTFRQQSGEERLHEGNLGQ